MEKIAWAFFSIFVLCTMIDAFNTPEWNFDVWPYGVAALQFSSESSHSHALELLQLAAPAKEYEVITSSSAYRKALRNDESALNLQLPFIPTSLDTLFLLLAYTC